MSLFEYNILAQRPDVEFWFTIIIFAIIIVANVIKSVSKASKDKKEMLKRQAAPQSPSHSKRYKSEDQWKNRPKPVSQRKPDDQSHMYDRTLDKRRKQAQLNREHRIQAQRQRAAELDRQRQQRMERLKRQNELIRRKEQEQAQAARRVKAASKKVKAVTPKPVIKPIVETAETPLTPQTGWFSVNDLSEMQAGELGDLVVISEILGKPKALMDD